MQLIVPARPGEHPLLDRLDAPHRTVRKADRLHRTARRTLRAEVPAHTQTVRRAVDPQDQIRPRTTHRHIRRRDPRAQLDRIGVDAERIAVRVADRVYARAAAEAVHIRTVAAREAVVARATVKEVVACSAREVVVAGAAVEEVITGISEDRIVTFQSKNRVVPIGTTQSFPY